MGLDISFLLMGEFSCLAEMWSHKFDVWEDEG